MHKHDPPAAPIFLFQDAIVPKTDTKTRPDATAMSGVGFRGLKITRENELDVLRKMAQRMIYYTVLKGSPKQAYQHECWSERVSELLNAPFLDLDVCVKKEDSPWLTHERYFEVAKVYASCLVECFPALKEREFKPLLCVAGCEPTVRYKNGTKMFKMGVHIRVLREHADANSSDSDFDWTGESIQRRGTGIWLNRIEMRDVCARWSQQTARVVSGVDK